MPTYANGKICYLEIPAVSIEQSAAFYSAAFDWQMRTRGDGEVAFDDNANEVSGTFVTGRPPSTSFGITIYIMIDDMEAAKAKVVAAGGTLVPPPPADHNEVVAFFADPAGNVFGLYQEPSMQS